MTRQNGTPRDRAARNQRLASGDAIALLRSMLRFLLPVFITAAALPSDFTGTVTRVLDGDTIDVTSMDYTIRVRLYGVDAPEKTQSGGPEATAFTKSLVLGNPVRMTERDLDRYGRVIGIVTLADGRVLNQEVLRAGMGRWYARYAPLATDLREIESRARTEQKGVWSDPAAQAPWDFRKEEYSSGTGSSRRPGHRSEPRSLRRSLRR
jgi:endonuclease YncB( thermonuclease family)